MKVPVSWLNELVKVDTDLEGLSDRLTFAGLEVEAIETVGSDFAGVVAGRGRWSPSNADIAIMVD